MGTFCIDTVISYTPVIGTVNLPVVVAYEMEPLNMLATAPVVGF
jgi:hypothetical protein